MCSHKICKEVNIRNYRIAYVSAIGESEGEVHHLDHDRKNNCLLNLVLLTKEEHACYHKHHPSNDCGVYRYLNLSCFDVKVFEGTLECELLELKNAAKKAALDFANDRISSDDMLMIVSKSMSKYDWLVYHSDGISESLRSFSEINSIVSNKAREQHLRINNIEA